MGVHSGRWSRMVMRTMDGAAVDMGGFDVGQP